MNIIEALQDPGLFGGVPTFHDLRPWRAWLVFLKAVYGLSLDPTELETFRKHTGRATYTPQAEGWREAVCIVGRQSGKSRIAALIAAFEAAMASREPDRTELYALMVSQGHRASMRTMFRYAAAPFETVPVLSRSVTSRTAETLTLDSGVVLAAYPCRPAALRGLRARVVVLDELAFYISGEGTAVDREMLRAVRPCLATTGGKLLILSSPYGQSGALWDLHRQHFGIEDSPILVWQASAPEMNPTLPADYLERMAQDDPEAYRSEVLGEFRAGLSALLDPEALEFCVAQDQREIPPAPGPYYRAFVDPSGGRRDAFTLAVGHRATDRIVVDAIRTWQPPFNPSGVVEEAATLLKRYHVSDVVGDRYAGEWSAEAFRNHGISYTAADKPKSDLYLELVPVVNSRGIDLLDVPELLRELRGLQRRRGPSGRDRVDHLPGGHDDLANAVAGLASLLPMPEGEHPQKVPPAQTTQEIQEREIQAMIDELCTQRERSDTWGDF